jgi:hypothetical protein
MQPGWRLERLTVISAHSPTQSRFNPCTACVRAKDPKTRAKTEGWTVTEFETHVQSQLLNLRQQLDAAVASDEPDQVASLSFQLDDLQRLSRDNRR